MKTLRVATLNLWNKSGPWQERKRLVCEELLRLQADVVGFQELLRLEPGEAGTGSEPPPSRMPVDPWSPDNDQLSELAATLTGLGGEPQQLAFFQAKSYGGGLVLGNGLMTRFELLDVRGFRLPGEESGETRSLLYALLNTPAGRLPVFVTHLNWKWHHGSVRVRQVQAIAEHIQRLEPMGADPGWDSLPPVLMGDFNAEPDSDEIRFLRGLHTLDGQSVFFADAWSWAGDGSSGYTFDRANGFAARSNEPPRRIDYVFVRGPDAWLRGEPLSARLAFVEPRSETSGGPGDRVWPSDHYGLVVDLAMERRNPPE